MGQGANVFVSIPPIFYLSVRRSKSVIFDNTHARVYVYTRAHVQIVCECYLKFRIDISHSIGLPTKGRTQWGHCLPTGREAEGKQILRRFTNPTVHVGTHATCGAQVDR